MKNPKMTKKQPAPAPAFSLPTTYTGEDWSVYRLRPGARDHERYGSLQPDGSVRPYAPPQYYATSSVAQVRER